MNFIPVCPCPRRQVFLFLARQKDMWTPVKVHLTKEDPRMSEKGLLVDMKNEE